MSNQTSQQAFNLCKIDIGSLSTFQRELHLAKTRKEEVESVFTYQIKKTSWGTHIPVKMDREETSESFVFTANNRFDFLMSTKLRQKLPAIALKDEAIQRGVEICWPHNVGHNIIDEGQLHFDDDQAQRIDPIWLDINSQFFMKPGFDKVYSKMIGSVPALEQWNVELPEWQLKINQPWCYAMDESCAVPLCRCSKSRVSHYYKMKRKIFDLLRVRCKNKNKDTGEFDGTYRNIKPSAKFFKNINQDDETLNKPELWAKYAVVNDNEREFHVKREPDYMYIRDIVHVSTSNPQGYGDNADITLVGNQPCLALFWVAQNQKALKYGNLSNYTTNSENVYEGWRPISEITMKHGTSPRFEKMPADIFDEEESLDNFPSAPREAGYFGYSFTHDIDRPNVNIGKCLGDSGTKLTVLLKNTDPYSKLEKLRDVATNDSRLDDELEDLINDQNTNKTYKGDTFVVHAVMLVVRKLQFIRNPETGELETCKVADQDYKKIASNI